jgi:ribosome-associated toxin RatA of RatAB toxin-antitoxin module
MAIVKKTEIFDVDAESLYQVIIDYESYPEFVDGVSDINVLKESSTGASVEYSLNLIKTFTYVLEMKHEKNKSVSWKLKEGDIFKGNTGSWHLKDLGNGKTEVTYELEVDFKVFAPKMITDKLVANNVPSMLKAYHERAKNLAKKKK